LKNLKAWLSVLRPPFLLLSICLVAIGTAAAYYEGFFKPHHFLLSLVGLLFAHMSVNVLNNYFDYISGIDMETEKTPFSGGDKSLPLGVLRPERVYGLGMLLLLAATLIGIYFIIVSGWVLLPILLVGGLVIYFYTTHLSKWVVGEFVAGLNLGPLAILGVYFVQTGSYGWGVLTASIAPGILTSNLLLLNQFPDVIPDRKAGRRNLVIVLGKRRAAKLFSALIAANYLVIVSGVLAKLMPFPTLVGLATVPVATKAVKEALLNYDTKKLTPAMKANVITVLGTQILLALGYLLAAEL